MTAGRDSKHLPSPAPPSGPAPLALAHAAPDRWLVSPRAMFWQLRPLFTLFSAPKPLRLRTWLQCHHLSRKLFSSFPQLPIPGRRTKLPLPHTPPNRGYASLRAVSMHYGLIISPATLIENHALLVRDFGLFIYLFPVRSFARKAGAIGGYPTKTNGGSLLAYQGPVQGYPEHSPGWCKPGLLSCAALLRQARGHILGIVKGIHGDQRDLPWATLGLGGGTLPSSLCTSNTPQNSKLLRNLHTGGSGGSVECFCFSALHDETAEARLERRQTSLFLHKHMLGTLPGL